VWVQGLASAIIQAWPWLYERGWNMSDANKDVTGVWHGLYSYDFAQAPVYFVATLLAGANWISGTSHEASEGKIDQALTLYAALEGSIAGDSVAFVKTYDGSGGWNHSVPYSGSLSPDGLEIEGTWHIKDIGFLPVSGRFLMIRSGGASEALVRKIYERA
jgi:hypothetical protein